MIFIFEDGEGYTTQGPKPKAPGTLYRCVNGQLVPDPQLIGDESEDCIQGYDFIFEDEEAVHQ